MKSKVTKKRAKAISSLAQYQQLTYRFLCGPTIANLSGNNKTCVDLLGSDLATYFAYLVPTQNSRARIPRAIVHLFARSASTSPPLLYIYGIRQPVGGTWSTSSGNSPYTQTVIKSSASGTFVSKLLATIRMNQIDSTPHWQGRKSFDITQMLRRVADEMADSKTDRSVYRLVVVASQADDGSVTTINGSAEVAYDEVVSSVKRF